MRQIKFRGWSKNKNEWIYGSLVNNLWVSSELTDHHGREVREIISNEYEEREGDCWEDIAEMCVFSVEHDSVGQFTGLTDKNGVDIYEGDILKHNKNHFFVRHSKNQHVLLLRDCNRKSESWRDLIWCANVQKYIEIVGNIHENPELLK